MISGVRSTTLKIVGSSAATPPGTPPGLPAAAGSSAAGAGVAPGRGSAGVTAIVADFMLSGSTRRSSGYCVRRREGLVVGNPPDSIATPSPLATISRQPIRPGYDTSSNVTVALSGMVVSGAVNAHSIRIVDSPPRPGGKAIEAAVGVSVEATPSTARRNSAPWAWQAGTAAAAVSVSVTSPSPSRSIFWRSWNAGISAMSMTTSRRISSGATAIPA